MGHPAFVAGGADWSSVDCSHGTPGLASSATNVGCPIQAVLWLEWDTTHSTRLLDDIDVSEGPNRNGPPSLKRRRATVSIVRLEPTARSIRWLPEGCWSP